MVGDILCHHASSHESLFLCQDLVASLRVVFWLEVIKLGVFEQGASRHHVSLLVCLPILRYLRPRFLCGGGRVSRGGGSLAGACIHDLLQESEAVGWRSGVVNDSFVSEDPALASRILGPVEATVEDAREALKVPAEVVTRHADAHIANYGLILRLGTSALHAPLCVYHDVAHREHYFVFVALHLQR